MLRRLSTILFHTASISLPHVLLKGLDYVLLIVVYARGENTSPLVWPPEQAHFEKFKNGRRCVLLHIFFLSFRIY